MRSTRDAFFFAFDTPPSAAGPAGWQGGGGRKIVFIPTTTYYCDVLLRRSTATYSKKSGKETGRSSIQTTISLQGPSVFPSDAGLHLTLAGPAVFPSDSGPDFSGLLTVLVLGLFEIAEK